MKVLTFALGAAAFAFFGYALFSSWSKLESENFAPQADWLIPIALLTAATVISGFFWRIVVKVFTGVSAPPNEAFGVHFGAWIMRYVPTIGSIAYKSLWLVARGFRVRLTSVPIIFEGLYVQITSFVAGIALLAPAWIQSGSLPNLSWVAISLALLVGPAFFLSSPLARRLLRLSEEETRLGATTPWTQLGLLASYLLPRLFTAAAAGLVGVNVGAVNAADAMAVGGAFLISAALGFLVPFVPSGLGIREGVFVAILVALGWANVTAVTISILLRFLTSLSDLTIAALWLWLRRGIKFDEPTEGKPL